MVDHARARRLSERIKVLAAEALERVVKDPDLGFVTITDCHVTPDLATSKIFYTVFGDSEQKELSAEILEKYRGRIRKDIGNRLGIKVTPTVEFLTDEIPESAAALNQLLAEAKQRDDDLAKNASSAKPAGEEDPYKHKEI
ncbi:MAG: 30S ribosome-binding factor RbfA [Microbacteriaceae bacterium]|nr:30S ribosome-binding factor RbfA [Microbacteriaceae bacterium]